MKRNWASLLSSGRFRMAAGALAAALAAAIWLSAAAQSGPYQVVIALGLAATLGVAAFALRSVWPVLIPALAAAGWALPPLSGRLSSGVLLAVAATTVTITVRGLRSVRPSVPPRFERAGRMEFLLLGFILFAGLLLRLPLLGWVPPGLTSDEAVRSLRAISLWTGEGGGGLPELLYPVWIVWEFSVALATRLMGVSVEIVRLPAAISGMAALPLAWLLARSLAGPAAGIGAALFLAGSFWHALNSRIALDPVNLVALGLLAGWLMLSPGLSKKSWAWFLGGAVSGLAGLGYAAGLYLPVWGLAVCGLRLAFPEGDRRGAFRLVLCFLTGLLVTGIAGRDLVKGRLAGARHFGGSVVRTQYHNELEPAANLLAGTARPPAQWTSYPPGRPRLSAIERAAVLFGLAALFVLRPGCIWSRWALGLWPLFAMLPEAYFGEEHLTRGLGALAPLCLMAGLAAGLVGGVKWRWAMPLALAAGLLNLSQTGWMLYFRFASDKMVHAQYESDWREAARALRGMLEEGPIELFPPPRAEHLPAISFLLYEEIRAGRIVAAERPPSFVRIQAVIRHPQSGEPVRFLVGGAGFPRDRRLALVGIEGLLEPGKRLVRAGRKEAATDYFRGMLGQVPDSPHLRQALLALRERP